MTEVLGLAPALPDSGSPDESPSASRPSPRPVVERADPPGPRRIGGAWASSWLLWAAVALIVAGVMVWRTMPNGVLLHNDSVVYVSVAHNLIDGQGVTSPFAHELSGLSPADSLARWGAQPLTAWPPLYPLVLAAGAPFGVQVETMGLWVNVLGVLAAVAMTMLLVRRLGGAALTAALVGVLTVVPVTSLMIFRFAGSESLFIPLSLAALLALLAALRRPDALPIGLFVVAAGAATLTRYMGLAIIGTAVLLLATRVPGLRRRRWLTAGAVGGLSALPAAVFFAMSRTQPGFRSGPRLQTRWDELDDAADTLLTWVLPSTDGSLRQGPALAAGLVLVVVTVGLAVWGYTRRTGAGGAETAAESADSFDLRPPDEIIAEAAHRAGAQLHGQNADAGYLAACADRRRRDALLAIGLHAGLYVVLLVSIASLLDHHIPLANRLLLPLAPSMLAVVAVGIERLVRSVQPAVPRRRLLGACALVLVVVTGINVANSVLRLASQPWPGVWTPAAVPDALRPVRSLPDDTVIVSNAPASVYLVTGRPVLSLPLAASVMTLAPNPDFDRSMDELVDIARNRSVVIAYDKNAGYFKAMDGRPIATGEQLAERLDLEVISEDPGFSLTRVRPRR